MPVGSLPPKLRSKPPSEPSRLNWSRNAVPPLLAAGATGVSAKTSSGDKALHVAIDRYTIRPIGVGTTQVGGLNKRRFPRHDLGYKRIVKDV